MKQLIFAAFLLLPATSTFSQTIDSMAIDTTVTPHTFFVRVSFPTPFYVVTRAQASPSVLAIWPPRYDIDIFVKECSPIPGPIQFDSTFEYSFYGGGYPIVYNMIVRLFLDTNTTDTVCGIRTQPQLVDGDGTSFSTPVTAIESPAAQLSGTVLFPNPAHSTITLQNSGGLALRILRLYGVTGQLLFIEPCNSSTFSIAHLPSGLYTAVIETDSGPIHQKLLIQH